MSLFFVYYTNTHRSPLLKYTSIHIGNRCDDMRHIYIYSREWFIRFIKKHYIQTIPDEKKTQKHHELYKIFWFLLNSNSFFWLHSFFSFPSYYANSWWILRLFSSLNLPSFFPSFGLVSFTAFFFHFDENKRIFCSAFFLLQCLLLILFTKIFIFSLNFVAQSCIQHFLFIWNKKVCIFYL